MDAVGDLEDCRDGEVVGLIAAVLQLPITEESKMDVMRVLFD